MPVDIRREDEIPLIDLLKSNAMLGLQRDFAGEEAGLSVAQEALGTTFTTIDRAQATANRGKRTVVVELNENLPDDPASRRGFEAAIGVLLPTDVAKTRWNKPGLASENTALPGVMLLRLSIGSIGVSVAPRQTPRQA